MMPSFEVKKFVNPAVSLTLTISLSQRHLFFIFTPIRSEWLYPLSLSNYVGDRASNHLPTAKWTVAESQPALLHSGNAQ